MSDEARPWRCVHHVEKSSRFARHWKRVLHRCDLGMIGDCPGYDKCTRVDKRELAERRPA